MDHATSLEHKERVRQAFDARAASWSAYYDQPKTFRSYSLLSRKRDVLELLFSQPLTGCRVLDLGCGSGDYLPELLERQLEVWCLDGSSEMVDRVKARFADVSSERLQIAQGDVEHLDYPAALFDGVICAGVLEYLQEDHQALTQLMRVLKPGGVAVITVTNARSLFSLINLFAYGSVRGFGGLLDAMGLFQPLRGRPRAAKAVFHRRHSPRRFRHTLTQLGFILEDAKYGSFGSFALNATVPCAVPLSIAYERFARHRLLGLLGVTYVVKIRKPFVSST